MTWRTFFVLFAALLVGGASAGVAINHFAGSRMVRVETKGTYFLIPGRPVNCPPFDERGWAYAGFIMHNSDAELKVYTYCYYHRGGNRT